MYNLKKKLEEITRKAKIISHPDKEEMRRQWDRKLQQDKLNQTRKK